MKHRQIGIGKAGVLNTDGHAIGVDIGATAVRAAVLAPGTLDGRPSVTVHGLGAVELPVGAVANGVVSDHAAVTNALKALWEQHKFQCRSVILGITNQQVVVRDLTLPNLPPEQLAKALPFQAREVVPLPLDQALLDFTPLEVSDPIDDTVSGLLVAAPRAPVLSAVRAVEAAGLRVARVDLSSFALLRSIADERLTVEAVIDIGAHLTSVVIHNQGVPKVVRAVQRGGHEITELLVAKGGLDEVAAEAAKRAEGLTGRDSKIVEMVGQGVRPMLAEIRSSIQYFGSTNAGARVERISLTGGGSALPGLADLLAQQVDVPTSVVAPTQHIRNRWTSTTGRGGSDEYAATAVSVGLAMGAAA
ncbi:MAG TPA: type IV pilus assembly protein PilM [Jatrophihabitans sp.]|jgi:type IV pilus assembly protein PilM|nr:type IV pilus assembly protein PilM [Jatrophihabitans sp.]